MKHARNSLPALAALMTMGTPAKARASSLRVAPTQDLAYIDSVTKHPDVYGPSHDDNSPPPDKLTAKTIIDQPWVIFLRVISHGADMGLFVFHQQGRGHICHVCLLPNCRGTLAVEAGKLAAHWMFKNTSTTALVAHCWEILPHVLWFAKRVGFEARTFVPWPARVGGRQIFSTGVCLTRERWKSLFNQKQ